MGAFVIAALAALVGVGLIVGILVLATLAIAGTKMINACHDGGMWFVNHRAQRRSHQV